MILACVFIVTSCYKDDSTRADYSLLETSVKIEGSTYLFWKTSTEDEPYVVNFTPELSFSKIVDGAEVVTQFTEEDYDKYDYRWRIARTAGLTVSDTLMYTISEQREIEDFLVEYNPDSPYVVHLELVEKATGMRQFLTYYAYIGASGGIGEGLLLADTRDGGTTSDISLLRAYPWATRDTELSDHEDGAMPMPIILNDLYSKKNGGAKLPGRVSSLIYVYYTNAAYRSVDLVVDGKHVIRLNDADFVETGRDASLFNGGVLPSPFNPQKITTQSFIMSYQKAVLINDNQLYAYQQNNTVENLFLPITGQTVEIDEDSAVTAIHGGRHGQYYDKQNGRIVGLFNGGGTMLYDLFGKSDEAAAFDWDNLPDFDCLYSGIWCYGYNYGYGGDIEPPQTVWILEKGGHRYAYVFSLGTGTGTANKTRGSKIYDMSGYTDFDQSTIWANSYITTRNNYGNTNQSQPELYYAVGNKIYCAILPYGSSSARPESKLVFEFPEGEDVTTMRWHIEYGYSSLFSAWNGDNPVWFTGNSCNNLLTVATWDGTDGKIYAIPRIFAGAGQLLNDPQNPENPLVFQQGGFGEITAIFPRQRY